MSDESLTKGQCIALKKVDGICNAMGCTPNEMMKFIKRMIQAFCS